MSDLRRNIEYNVDQSSINKAKQELEKLAKKETELAGSILKADSATDEQLKSLRKVQKEQRDLVSVLRVVDSAFGKQEDGVNEATSALKRYEEQIRKTKESGADFGGDSASFIAGTRGGLDALTGGNLGGLGTGLEKLEGVADLVEFLPQLNVQAGILGDSLRGVDGNLGNTIAKFTGLSSGVSAFLTVAVPAVAVLGTLAVGYTALQKVQEKQIEAIRLEAEARERAVDFLIQGSSTDEVNQRLAEIANERAILETQLVDQSQENYDEYIQQARGFTQTVTGTLSEATGSWVGALNPLGQAFGALDFVTQNFGETVDFTVQQLDGSEQAYADIAKEHKARLEDLSAEEAQLVLLRDQGAFVTNDAAVAEENLAREREEATRQAEQAVAHANQLQAQMDQIRSDALLADANAAELEAVQNAIDNENAQIREQEHRNALAKIADDGRKRIEQIDVEMKGLGAKQADDLADSLRKGNEKLASLEQEYQQSTIQKYEDFTDSLKDAQDDASKTLRRLARDIKNSLTDATLENDAAAFLKAQRDGQDRVKDAAEDATDQQKRMVDDFIKAQEREREAYMEKQTAIHQAIAEEKQQIIQAYQERRQALADQIAAERQATQERLTQEAARHQQQLENEARRANQQAQLDAIRERQQQEAHNRRLQEIQQQRAAELAKFQAVASVINSIKIPSSGGFGGFGGSQTPISKTGERSGKGGNNIFASINNQVSNVIGDIASKGEVSAAMDENNRVLLGAITKTIKGASGRRRPT